MKPIALGDFTIRKFVESTGNMDLPSAIFGGLGGARLAQLREAMDPRCGDPASDLLYLSMHSFVLQAGGRTILIDTCNGNHKHRTGIMAGMNMMNTDYLGNLARLGLKPDDIDVVLCTHLHSDHVGWNTRLENGAWVPTFANARYLMSQADVEFYGGMQPDHPQYALTRESYDDSVLPVLNSGQAELVRTGHIVEHEVGNGVWLEGCPGHTPGTMVVHAQCGHGRHAVFTGDVFHHPVQIQDVSLNMGVDTEPELAYATRKRVVETYANTDTILLAAHFPEPTAGCVVTDGGQSVFKFLE
jgi:glyoxylase-like metal-dependent hydrolase (beta-lactamase superfamily II)